MKYKFVAWLMRLIATALPIISLAAWEPSDVLNKIINLAGQVIQLLYILLSAYFIWGIIEYVSAKGDVKKLEQGKQHIFWGLIGLGVAAGMWGIGKMILGFLGFEGAEGGIPSGPGK